MTVLYKLVPIGETEELPNGYYVCVRIDKDQHISDVVMQYFLHQKIEGHKRRGITHYFKPFNAQP